MQGITTASSRPGHPAAAAGRTIENPHKLVKANNIVSAEQADILSYARSSTLQACEALVGS